MGQGRFAEATRVTCDASACGYDRAVTRHFLTGVELARDELERLLARALELKRERVANEEGVGSRPLTGRSVALLFERPSTRTRVSFEVGIAELGGTAVVLSGRDLQLARGESLGDTAAVLSGYVHAIGARTGRHAMLEELAASARVPVVNMLTEEHHPCQALADMLTLSERFGTLAGLKLAYLGDGNNVASSLMLLGASLGVEVAVAGPAELAPDEDVVRLAQGRTRADTPVSVLTDPEEAVRGAHALYTDVWVSMGDEAEAERRRELLTPYRLDDALLAHARQDAVALHCLPAHPGEEISAEVLYGPRSAVWDQAENRLHAQKALLELLLAPPR
ncbi:ornithine carbamoyltransferase [soil metagenome]